VAAKQKKKIRVRHGPCCTRGLLPRPGLDDLRQNIEKNNNRNESSSLISAEINNPSLKKIVSLKESK